MFTGLIQEVGKVIASEINREGRRLEIFCPQLSKEIKVKDSIAVNGVCLTAEKILPAKQTFVAQAVHLTLEKTNLGTLEDEDAVNLELAMTLNDRLGGHLVQGHVGGQAKITKVEKSGENWVFSLQLQEKKLARYLIAEGSLTLDGISLTIAQLHGEDFSVTIIPHTLKNTHLQHKRAGDLLNLEVDMVAKHIEKLMEACQKDGECLQQ